MIPTNIPAFSRAHSVPRHRRALQVLTSLGCALLLPLWMGAAAGPPAPHRTVTQEPTPPLDLTEDRTGSLTPPTQRAIDALLGVKNDEALAEFDRLLKEEPDFADAWTVYRAETLRRMGRSEEALKSLDGFEDRFPGSAWISKARFRRAELARTAGDPAAAELILREEAEALRGPDRRDELCAVYLEVATELTAEAQKSPGESRERELLERASKVLVPAVALETSAPMKARAQAQAARVAMLARDWMAASSLYEQALSSFDLGTSELAATFGVDARLAAAWALHESQRHQESRRLLQDLQRELGEPANGKDEPWTAEVRGEILAGIGDAWYAEGRLDLAISAWEKLVESAPDHPMTAPASARITAAHRQLSHVKEALGSTEQSTQLPAPRPWAEGRSSVAALTHRAMGFGAQEEIAQKARALAAHALFERGEILMGAQRFNEALKTFAAYVTAHAGEADWAQAETNIVRATYEHAAGELERSKGDVEKARASLDAFAAEFPLDSRRDTARLTRAELPSAAAKKWMKDAPLAEQRAAHLESVEELLTLAARVPRSHIASRALYRAAFLCENELEEPARAVEIYRRVDFGPDAGSASQRREAMLKETLQISTPRLIRGGEPLEIDVFTRNIEAVDVQTVHLDLGAYFQRHHRFAGIEDLDLDLIAADAELEVLVADYQRYAPLKRAIAVPIGDAKSRPGVYAVSVIAAGKRATTLVIQSDLDMIAKRSRGEVFVFVTEVKAGQDPKPAKGVEISVSHTVRGERVLSTMTTGADGIARMTPPKDESFDGDTRILAARNGHVATVELAAGRSTAGAQELGSRAALHTDRSAYRPGETVNLRAVLRTAKDGRFTMPVEFKKPMEVRFQLVAPDGEVAALTQDAPLSSFGTADASFTLDGAAPEGNWTVQVVDPRRSVWASAALTVAEFDVPRALLTLEAQKSVALRGETVEVTAKAATGFGVPLAGDIIRWTDPEGQVSEATLDGDGEAVFVIRTTDVYDDQTLQLWASLPESGDVAADFQLRVAQVAMKLTIEADREVVLAGSSFNATLRANAADGSPLAGQSLTVTAIRTEPQGESSFQAVTELERSVQTGEDGTVSLAVPATGGGPITLRVQGRDAFEQRVEAAASVFASGDDDADRLRIVESDAQRVVGEATEIQVVDRTGGGLALLTVEGSKVIEHRVVTLDADTNILKFDVSDAFVPDVEVSLSAIRDRSFFHRTATIRVSRPLGLEVELAERLSPSGETTLTLRTTDGRGRPVSAEVALSLVDAGLFALFPDSSSGLDDTFAGRPSRTPSFETGASSTFEYRGKTEEIDQAILDEAARSAAQLERDAMSLDISDAFEESEGMPMPMAAAPMRSMRQASPKQSLHQDTLLGMGGGAGGKFGGRFGGKKRLGQSAPPRRNGPEANPTAYWNAAVVTDEASGTATIKIPVPAREARWILRARGVTADHRFGEATAETVTSAPFVLEVTAPTLAFVGDAPRVMAQLFAETPASEETKVQWELRAEAPGGTQVLKAQSVLSKGESRSSAVFDALEPLLAAPEATRLVVTAEVLAPAGASSLTASKDLRVRPGGIEIFDTASGTTTDFETLILDAVGSDRELTMSFGAGASAWLVGEALSTSTAWRLAGCRRIAGPKELAASLFAAASILNAGTDSGGLPELERTRLWERCHGLVSALVARRVDGNGWGSSFAVTSASGNPDAEVTARVLVALNEAKKAGIETPGATIERALGVLNASLADERDPERRAWILWGQSAGDRSADDLALGRMHRERVSLPVEAQAALACALIESGRAPMAKEVAQSLSFSPDASTETNALALLGRAYAGLSGPTDFEAIYGTRPWGTTTGSGLACAASAKAGALARAKQRSATFTVRLNGGDVAEYKLDERAPVLRISPALESAAGPVRVELNLRAGDRLDYAIALGAITDKTPEATLAARVRERETLNALPKREGRVLATGFNSVLESRDERWVNQTSQLEFGKEARIRVQVSRTRSVARGEQPEDYEVEVPLPAGVAARDQSSGGTAMRFQDGSLFVAFQSRGQLHNFDIEVVGLAPGTWTLPPPVIRGSNDPGEVAYGEAGTLTVLAPGEKSADPYRATPDELLDRGRAAFEDGAFAEARGSLRPLFKEWREELTPRALAEIAKLLLFSSLSAAKAEGKDAAAKDAANPNQIVDWFEILKEREPELFVSFDDTMLVADAYESIGEFDRATSLFRAVIDETLGEDMRVAAALDEMEMWSRASSFIADTWSRYPDSPKAQDADLALAARLIDRGLGDEPFRGANAQTRKALVLSGLARLMRIAAMAPESAAADAGLAMVSAFVELEDWENAAERAAVFGAAFELPRVRDEFRYTEAVARWSMEQDDRASKLLGAIVDARYPVAGSAGGRTKESENRDLALYILGQIEHARRKPAAAMEFYERVADQFPDAKAALAELRSERLELAEDVVRVAPGDQATVAFRHRGIDEVEVLIYPVDLMTLALRERDLSRVTAVDLAGVTPTRTETVKVKRAVLGLESGELTVDLKEPGAYLAMLRAGVEHRSTLILVSDLEVEVDVAEAGTVRAHLRRRSDKSFPRGAAIRVLDLVSGAVASGKTDPRGLYTARTASGKVTVIARTPGKHYAFAGVSQPIAAQTETQSQGQDKYDDSVPAYLENVLRNNRSQVLESQGRFDEDIQRSRKGIQVQSAGGR